MVEYLVKYRINDGYRCECTVIAKSISHALDLVDAYIEKECSEVKQYEIYSCEFVQRIDTLLIEKV